MTIAVSGLSRRKVPASVAAGDQTFTSVVTEDDPNNQVQLETTVSTTPDPQTVANCNAASGVDVVTAPANAFSVVRVGDVVTGDPGLPGGVTVLAITPSPDGVVDDQLQLSAVTTGVITAATLTFTGAAVVDPVVVSRLSFTASGGTLRATLELFAFDGSTAGPSSPIDLTGLTASAATGTVSIDYDQFLVNQRLDSPT